MYNQLRDGVRAILFPKICMSCKGGLPGSDRLICVVCATTRFEDPNPDRYSSPPDVLLPEIVYFFDAMWQFDTAGGLRDMLHALKYDGLLSLGHELGGLLHDRVFSRRPETETWNRDNTLLLPVPMHRARLRARGYNQATEIARGFSARSGISIICDTVVERIRYTKSQTGFSQAKRVKNLKGAFAVSDSACIVDRKVIIIDDVYTTGSTTFELAATIHAAGCGAIGILTVAAT